MPVTVTSTTRTADEMAQAFGLVEPEPAPQTPPADSPAAEAEPVGDGDPDAPDVGGQTATGESTLDVKPKQDRQPERRISRAQQRVNDALRDKKQAEIALDKERAERQRLADRIAALEAGQTRPPTPPAAAPAQPPAEPKAAEDPEPKEDDFSDWSEYQRSLARWEGRQEARRLLAEDAKARETVSRQQQLEQERTRQIQTYTERARSFATEAPDFEAVIDAAPQVAPIMNAVILGSEVGPEMAYHFGKHPVEAERIRALPPAVMVAEMHRLEGRLLAMREGRRSPSTPGAPPPVATTSAPPPPPRLPSGASAQPGSAGARTFREYEEARERELAARRQAQR